MSALNPIRPPVRPPLRPVLLPVVAPTCDKNWLTMDNNETFDCSMGGPR
jgi:hypothetical protein